MKKEELRHDPIRENIVKGVQYLSKNRTLVFKSLAIIILVIAGLSYYNYQENIKSESASRLAGRAQNIFIGDENGNNGKLDEALVKFERILYDYPNTIGAVQSMIYLLGDAIHRNDMDEASKILSNNFNKINDTVVLSAISKLNGDVAVIQNDDAQALKHYKKARLIAIVNDVKYKLDVASSYMEQENFIKVVQILEPLIEKEDLGYNEKNIAEELLAYSRQKLNI